MCCNKLIENEHIPEIRLAVEGWPPKKNEATSLFSKRHGDYRNVVELLGKAKKRWTNRSGIQARKGR